MEENPTETPTQSETRIGDLVDEGVWISPEVLRMYRGEVVEVRTDLVEETTNEE